MLNRTAATDAAIQKLLPWDIACGALEFRFGAQLATPAGPGSLRYERKIELSLECTSEFTPEQCEAIGR